MVAVETREISKSFSRGRVQALSACSLQVPAGIIFTLLGPNGAGKTTLIKILTGLLHPDGGGARLLGAPLGDVSVRRRIGYLSENHRFPEFLTPNQVLFYFGRMAGLERADLSDKIPRLLRIVKLESWSNVKIRKFSKGMMQRLGLAHALVNDPELVFLDEPTDGIDPVGRREIRDLLIELRNRGVTLFINSHLLSEVERISDEVAILDRGVLLEKGRIDRFLSQDHQVQIRLAGEGDTLPQICAALEVPVSRTDDVFTITIADDQQLNRIIDEVRKAGALIRSITPSKISLEDYFIKVVEEGGEQK